MCGWLKTQQYMTASLFYLFMSTCFPCLSAVAAIIKRFSILAFQPLNTIPLLKKNHFLLKLLAARTLSQPCFIETCRCAALCKMEDQVPTVTRFFLNCFLSAASKVSNWHLFASSYQSILKIWCGSIWSGWKVKMVSHIFCKENMLRK